MTMREAIWAAAYGSAYTHELARNLIPGVINRYAGRQAHASAVEIADAAVRSFDQNGSSAYMASLPRGAGT